MKRSTRAKRPPSHLEEYVGGYSMSNKGTRIQKVPTSAPNDILSKGENSFFQPLPSSLSSSSSSSAMPVLLPLVATEEDGRGVPTRMTPKKTSCLQTEDNSCRIDSDNDDGDDDGEGESDDSDGRASDVDCDDDCDEVIVTEDGEDGSELSGKDREDGSELSGKDRFEKLARTLLTMGKSSGTRTFSNLGEVLAVAKAYVLRDPTGGTWGKTGEAQASFWNEARKKLSDLPHVKAMRGDSKLLYINKFGNKRWAPGAPTPNPAQSGHLLKGKFTPIIATASQMFDAFERCTSGDHAVFDALEDKEFVKKMTVEDVQTAKALLDELSIIVSRINIEVADKNVERENELLILRVRKKGKKKKKIPIFFPIFFLFFFLRCICCFLFFSIFFYLFFSIFFFLLRRFSISHKFATNSSFTNNCSFW